MSRLEQARSRLAEHYRLGLKAKAEALAVERRALAEGIPEAVTAVRRAAHQLRGSGASFGHPHITEAAATVEQAPHERLGDALDDLISVLRQTSGEGPTVDRTFLLIVEGDNKLAGELEQALAAPDRQIHTVTTIGAARSWLKETPVDLVILDLIMPDCDGRHLLTNLQDRPQTANVPVLVLSPTAAARTQTECLALGAEQCLEKPFAPELLSATVSGILRRRQRHSDEVRIDSLTKLTNRAGFREQFERAIKLSDRADLPLALAILDLDHFKRLNDTYGHNAGDAVLRKIGATLTDSVRQSDLPARWGGEEFVVLFQNTRAEVALSVLHKLQDALRAVQVEVNGGKPPVLTLSGGVVDVAANDTLDAALSRADKLLYHAKSTGRDRVLWTIPEETRDLTGRILLAEDDANTARLVTANLEAEGLSVSHFPDGKSALSAALASPPSLAILDKVMPGLDGFEVLRRIRNTASDRSVPVIMLTAVGREEEIERAFDLGADDYVQKPFKTRELIARVRRLLRQERR